MAKMEIRMRTMIFSGGQIELPFAKAYMEKVKPEYVIAADSGMEICKALGIIPDCIVGDFDSVSKEVLAYYHTKPQILWKQFRPEKDETDTELALRTSFEHGATEIHLLGATGSRLDHVLANIQLLQKALIRGIPAYMVDANNRISLIDEKRVLEKKKQYGKYVSLLPLTTTVEKITLTGFKYPLDHATLHSDDSLGVSNEITEDTAVIEFEEGIAILIESRD